jgi:hypothetical protein
MFQAVPNSKKFNLDGSVRRCSDSGSVPSREGADQDFGAPMY